MADKPQTGPGSTPQVPSTTLVPAAQGKVARRQGPMHNRFLKQARRGNPILDSVEDSDIPQIQVEGELDKITSLQPLLEEFLKRVSAVEALSNPDVKQARDTLEGARALYRQLTGDQGADLPLVELMEKLNAARERGRRAGEAERTAEIANLKTQLALTQEEIDSRQKARDAERRSAHKEAVGDAHAQKSAHLSKARMEDLVIEEDQASHREHAEQNRQLERLNGRVPMLVAFGSQVISAWLSASGIAAMARNEGGTLEASQYVVPIGIAAALNGFMYFLTVSRHNDGWTFRGNKGVATAFVVTAGLTVGTNYAGMSSTFVPNDIAAYTAAGPLNEAQNFINEAGPVLQERILEPVADSVQEVIDDGMILLDEATGKGPTHQYGFKGESIERLADYRETVSKAVKDLSKLGACDGVMSVEGEYQKAMDRLQDELKANPEFFVTDFVRVDESGEKVYDMDLEPQIEACLEANPDSPGALARNINSILGSVQKDLADGKIKDTVDLNPEIRELNEAMKKLSALTDVEAKELEELDPMFFESWKIFLDNAENLWNRLANKGTQTVLAWPIVMLIFSGFQDQLGMLVALAASASRKGRKKLAEARAKELSKLKRLDDLGERSETLLQRMRGLYSGKTK